jgi:putative phosphoribosyl transferase
VLGLARGGVAVASEVARAIDVSLDVLVVRKLGVPWKPELAMGAIAPGRTLILEESILQALEVPEQVLRSVAIKELQELEQTQRTYRQGRPSVSIAGKIVILVDDGIATGSSMRAAIASLRRQGTVGIVAAVASASACNVIRKEADELVCLAQPEPFHAVSQWYVSFSQLKDDDVRILLDEAAREVQTTV